MAKIRDRRSKESSGGYQRVFGNEELGHLMSRVQGSVIANGTELERIITSKVPKIENLDTFLERDIMKDGVLARIVNHY